MDRFKEKLGPLPLWAWALIALAVIGVIYFLSKNGGGLGSLFGGSSATAPSGGAASGDLGSLTGALSQLPNNPQPPSVWGNVPPVTQSPPMGRAVNPSNAGLWPGGGPPAGPGPDPHGLPAISPVARAPIVHNALAPGRP